MTKLKILNWMQGFIGQAKDVSTEPVKAPQLETSRGDNGTLALKGEK